MDLPQPKASSRLRWVSINWLVFWRKAFWEGFCHYVMALSEWKRNHLYCTILDIWLASFKPWPENTSKKESLCGPGNKIHFQVRIKCQVLNNIHPIFLEIILFKFWIHYSRVQFETPSIFEQKLEYVGNGRRYSTMENTILHHF